jgi:hypothetical protein
MVGDIFDYLPRHLQSAGSRVKPSPNVVQLRLKRLVQIRRWNMLEVIGLTG